MPPKRKYTNLPLRMTQRTYTNQKGDTWVGYYYEHPRDETGKKRVEPLGSDLGEAKLKWAKIEGSPLPLDQTTLEAIYERYMQWAEKYIESGLSPRTIKDRRSYWKELSKAYGKMNINSIKPEFILPYFHARSSKVSAKKEIKFLSVIFNWARARGFMSIQNPVTGLTRQMKVDEKRSIYVSDIEMDLVYKNGSDVIRDAIDIAYFTGQRPADVRKMRWSDIKDGVLEIVQNKTKTVVRIEVMGELSDVLERIRNRGILGMTILSDQKGQPLNQFGHLRNQFNKARDAAEAEAKALGIEFQRFQLRDLRAKAATDLKDDYLAKGLLGHKSINTTTAYLRGNKNHVVQPVLSKSLLDKGEKTKGDKKVSG